MTVEDQVITIISEWYGKSAIGFSRSTRIYQDLHAYGDDIDELLIRISNEYKRDLSTIDLTDCFPSEPHAFTPLIYIAEWIDWFSVDKKKPGYYHPVYIDDLINWAENGIWPDIKTRPFMKATKRKFSLY
jgi:hypothetical protein